MDKKETLWALGLGLALFAGVPALARYLLPPEAGMAFSMLFLLAVHPVFFLTAGAFCGRRPRSRWPLPALLAALFIFGYGLVLRMWEPFYPLLYLALGYLALAAAALRRRVRRGGTRRGS